MDRPRRFTGFVSRATLSALAPLLLLAVVLSLGTDTLEHGSRAVRNFQMALFTYDYHTGVTAADTAGYVDIPMFGSDIPSLQPPGRSIMRFESWQDDDPLRTVTVDWSRILAVLIDEPYVTRLQSDHNDDAELNPCAGSIENQQTRRPLVRAIRAKLMNAVRVAHEAAPRARVWVNFHRREVSWMREADCEQLNDPSIDVVSLDRYEVNFSRIRGDYAWFMAAMPHQQIALVPGTHHRVNGDSPSRAAARLQGYFDYANRQNRRCDLDMGRAGPTGSDDGCRVWIVVGWSAEPAFPSYAPEYYGLLHPSSAPIAAAWLEQFSKPRRIGARAGLGDDSLPGSPSATGR